MRRAPSRPEESNAPPLERLIAREHWGAACRWIEDRAAGALRQGEWRPLKRSIETIRLRAADLRRSPTLSYWLAECELRAAGQGARAAYEEAFRLFGEAGDAAGQLRSAAGVVCASRLLALPDCARWVTLLERLWGSLERRASGALEPLYCLGLVAAAPLLPPRSGKLERAARRLGAALDSIEDGCWRIAAAAWLVELECQSGRAAEAAKYERAVDPVLDTPQVPPWIRHAWHLAAGMRHEYVGDRQAALAALDAADAIAGEGVGPARCAAVALRRMILGLRSGDAAAAAAHEPRLRDCEGPSETALAQMARAWLAFERGEPALCASLGKSALALAQGAGDLGLEARCAGLLALALSGCGRHGDAESTYLGLEAWYGPLLAPFLRFEIQLWGALIALARGDAPRGLRRLRRAMKAGEAKGYTTLATCIPRLLARLCAAALREDAGAGCAVSLVRRNGLWTDDPGLERWPWPIRIYVMDRLEILLGGAPLRPSRKEQKRPLDLLKGIVAYGGRGVDASLLIECLWPDSDGDAGQRALDSTLLRLRRLLGRDDAVLLSGRKLSLNARLCWVDAWALEHAADRGGETAPAGLARDAGAVLRLYRGGFLEKEEPQPWTIARAERLRSKFMRCMLRIGAGLENAGQLDRAVAIYRRCVEVDPLAEEFQLRLMQIHARLGQSAEGMAAYRRYRSLLSIVLGVPPSAKAQAAFRALASASRAETGAAYDDECDDERGSAGSPGPQLRGNE